MYLVINVLLIHSLALFLVLVFICRTSPRVRALITEMYKNESIQINLSLALQPETLSELCSDTQINTHLLTNQNRELNNNVCRGLY